MRVVHILKYGLAMCGLGPPEKWPTAHRWVSFEVYKNELHLHSFCWDCIDAMAAKETQTAEQNDGVLPRG